MKKITIVCDGACSGNGNGNSAGGWGAVLKYGTNTKELCGGAPSTTNNIMELTAVIEALDALKSADLEVSIFSDSAYVVNCFKQGWYVKWQKNGWINSKKEPVENKALWQLLLAKVEGFHRVNFYKIKGHLDLNKPSDVDKWYAKFNKDNALSVTRDFFEEIVLLNHRADALANEGMAPFR